MDRVAAARADLLRELAVVRDELARLREQALLSRDEERDLQGAAESGAMGSDLQEIASRVREGEVSWAEVLHGDPPYDEAVRRLVRETLAEHSTRVAAAFADHPAYDSETRPPG